MSDLEDYESEVDAPDSDNEIDKEEKEYTSLSLKKSQPSSKIKSELPMSDNEFDAFNLTMDDIVAKYPNWVF